MSAQYDPPLEYDFGLDFNYASWNEDTVLTFCQVPWDNTYRDIVKFANRAALNAFIDNAPGPTLKFEDVRYIKPNLPVKIGAPFNVLNRFNYLRASNPLMPVEGDLQKDYYYFVVGVNYIAPETTEVILQLDVWQTYGYDISFGRSYIDRGHIGMADSGVFANYGRDKLTIPEGIDIGGEYQILERRNKQLMSAKQSGLVDEGLHFNNFDIVIVSTIDLQKDFGTVSAPIINSATGKGGNGLPTGANIYVLQTVEAFKDLMAAYSDKPWVTAGIQSITAVPRISDYGITVNNTGENSGFFWGTTVTAFRMDSFGGGYSHGSLYSNWRNTILNLIPARYRGLKKLLTSPYMMIEMTAFNGRPLVIKPELWNHADAEINYKGQFLPPSQRLVMYPADYNARTGISKESWHNPAGGVVLGDDGGEYLDFATFLDDFPTFMIVNNNGIMYLAQNARSLAWQNQAANWSQQRALRGNETAYDQASSGIDLMGQLTGNNVNMGYAALGQEQGFQNDKFNFDAVSGFIRSSVGGALAGGPVGAVGGAGGGLIDTIVSSISLGMSQKNAAAQLGISSGNMLANSGAQQGQSGYIRDTNKGLADWAARGDYENTIAGINARVQDAQTTQPSVIGQMGGNLFNLQHNAYKLSLRWKFLDGAALKRVGEYWFRYGYAVRQFAEIPASLQVMSKFTYWKLLETYIISGPMPESFKQAIRGIFEKGVTVWANPADIGVIDIADNTPLEGITL